MFRPYSGPGGIQEELVAQAAAHPAIAELQVIGQTVNGQDITAVRVTQQPRSEPRPASARRRCTSAPSTPGSGSRLRWCGACSTTSSTGYGTDPEITALVDTNELWFVPVANPDGYDFSFEEGPAAVAQEPARQRRRRRDHAADGVDLNRNFPTRWGYDNEGSSPNPASDTYRGTAPAPSRRRRRSTLCSPGITPEFFVNYHSAAELLLHGIGWQVATPSPDDVMYEAMVGDDAEPAVPGYDPDISAELYTTNGDTDTHMQEAYGTLGFTPEMSTCEAASPPIPTTSGTPRTARSGFEFPDDEALIQAEFEKNIPFALAVAESAADPDDPVSVVGIDTPNFVVDSFDVSYGDPQTGGGDGQAGLRSDAHGLPHRRRPDTPAASPREWAGGERYGFENDDYYAEYRGVVRGADGGDQVEVWFSGHPTIGTPRARRVESEHFTYTVASDTDTPVLVIANEDYTGVNPTTRPASPRRSTSTTTSPRWRPTASRRRLGRRRPGRAARPRCAQPLRRRRLVPRRQPPDPRPRGRADRLRWRPGPDLRSPNASST